MAELLLMVGDGAGYQDGDILCAYNSRRIALVHAQHICASGALLEKLLERSYRYRFQRTGEFTLERIDLRTSETVEYSNKPDSEGQHIDVPLFISRRKRQPNHKIFGAPGSEYWFGGEWQPDTDAIWNEIENRSAHRRANYTLWPLGEQEKRSHLALAVDDFDDAEAELLTAPRQRIVGDVVETVAKRARRVDWRALSLPVSRTDIEDRTKAIDIRQALTLQRATVVRERTR